MKQSIKKGGIYFCDLDPVKGSEQGRKRPVLVISNNRLNAIGSLVTILPITNTKKTFPLHIALSDQLKTTGKVLCDQIRTIDSAARQLDYVESVDTNTLDSVLEIVLAIIE